MKIIVKIILFSFLFIPFLHANATSFNMTIETDKKTYNYKENVEVKISTSKLPNYGMASSQIYLTYDNNYLSFNCKNVEYNKSIKNNEIDCNDKDGKIIILYVDNEVGASPITNGDFLELTFRVNKKIKTSKSSTFTLTGEGFAGVEDNKVKELYLENSPKTSIKIENNVSAIEKIISTKLIMYIILLILTIVIIKRIIRRKKNEN